MLWKCSTAHTQHSTCVCTCMHACFCCSKWAHKVPTKIRTLWHPSGLLHHARTKTSNGNRLALVPNNDSSNFLFASLSFLVSPWSRVLTQDCSVIHLCHFTCWFCFLYVKKKAECGTALAFVARLRPDSVTCLFGTQYISVQGATACAATVTKISGAWTFIPCQLKHLQFLWLISSSCQQEHWKYPLFSVHAWTRLFLFFFFFLTLHQNFAFKWLGAHEQKTTVACGALSCPKIWVPQLYSRKQRGTDRLPAPEIPQKSFCSPSQWHPAQPGGLLDICNSAHCALDATALIAFSSRRAIAFPLAATC